MQLFIAGTTLSLASAYVLLLAHLTLSPRVLQQVLVIPTVILVIVFYYAAKNSWKLFSDSFNLPIILFAVTVFLEMLIISTGGISSPFLILIHLVMVTISFLFSFPVALLFLIFSFMVIFIDMSFYQNVFTTLITDPSTMLLQLVSLIVIIPIAYIVSRQYHQKDIVFAFLKTKIATDEAIFRSLKELIIVTDADLHIISVNDAAAKSLQRSRSELLDKPLFDVLLLKDATGQLLTRKSLFPQGNTQLQPNRRTDTLTLFQSPMMHRDVTLHVQTMKHLSNAINQISFVISFPHTDISSLTVTLEEARARYDALVQGIKKKLSATKTSEVQTDMLLLEKIEQDTYTVRTIEDLFQKKTIAKIDIAKLCKQAVAQNQDFAKALHVNTTFALKDFGQKDIAPLTVKSYPVTPEQLTGPFFTVSCDVRQVELIVKKLFDIAIFLAAPTDKPLVTVNVKRKQAAIEVRIEGTCMTLDKKMLDDIFVPYYGRIAPQTTLQMGSGLEGFLVKQLTERLKIPLEVNYKKTPESTISFTLLLQK
jgi:PAS domain-containing protein